MAEHLRPRDDPENDAAPEVQSGAHARIEGHPEQRSDNPTPPSSPAASPNTPSIPEGVGSDAWNAIGAVVANGEWRLPERNADGEIIGWVRRTRSGTKIAVPGSKRGLTLAWPLGPYSGTSATDPIIVVEGPSDTAAGMGLSLDIVGRPSASGGAELLAALLKDKHICICAENDQKPEVDGKPGGWPGRAGAEKTARDLVEVCKSVKIIYPPKGCKDLRAWIIAGGTRADVDEAIKAAEAVVAPADQSAEKTVAKLATKASTLLLELMATAQLFHTSESEAYARVRVGDHAEVHRIRSRPFKLWCKGEFYSAHGYVPNAEAVEEALGAVEAMALYKSPERPVHVRLAAHDGAYYLDLADARWRVVRIDASWWRIVDDSPVMFRRPKGMLSLPEPRPGGSLDQLRRLINVGSEDNWHLLVAWLVAAVRPRGPYPVLALYGEQGSAKSTAAKLLRRIIDPNKADLRTAPSNERDLAIAAHNGWVVALDNLSVIQPWLSDALCRMSTGGGFSARTLYENDEQTLFDYIRPVILTGIEDLATRPDLLDRAVVVVLPTIPEDARRTEAVLWADFERDHPYILGAVLTVVSSAMARVDSIVLKQLPRLADFATWMVAAEPAIGWKEGSFLSLYLGNRASANITALEASPIIPPLLALVEKGAWSGSPTQLLKELASQAGIESRTPEGWPKQANVLTGALSRLAPNLRAIGIEVKSEPGRSRGRIITVRCMGQTTVPTVPIVPESGSGNASEDRTGRSPTGRDDAASGDRPAQMPVQAGENPDQDGRDDQDGLARVDLESCRACSGKRWWRLPGQRQANCNGCHPPAPDLEIEWLSGESGKSSAGGLS